jgi:hypothetical protein
MIDGGFIICDELGCTKRVKNHRWGKTKAEGWFFSRADRGAFCPDHIPAWVVEWRAKNDNGGLDG